MHEPAVQETSSSTTGLILRLIRLGLRHKIRLAFAMAVTIAVQLLIVAELVTSGLAIDVLRHSANPDAPAPDWPLGLRPPEGIPLLRELVYVSLAVLLFSVLRAVGYYAARLADELLAQAIVVRLRDDVYRQLQRLPFGFYDRHNSGTIINRVTGDVQSVRTFIQSVLQRALTALVALIISVGTMLLINVNLTLVTLIFLIAQIVIMARFGRMARPEYQRQRVLLDGLTTQLSESVQGIQVIRAFGRDREQTARFEQSSEVARDQRYGIWKLMSNHMPLIVGSNWMAVAALVGYGGYLVQLGPAEGGIALGAIWVFYGLLRSLAQQAEQIVGVAAQIPEALTGAERVFAILDTQPEITSPAVPQPLPVLSRAMTIEFRNVRFGFDEAEPVLRDISFRVDPGEIVALVGPTGAGKTTLLQLIPRFYDPQQGQVLLDGIDVRELELDQLRRSIGIVFQEPYLFSNTIGNNIAFGRPDVEISEIRRVAAVASADRFIERLDTGYDTIIGERGMTLSGGERQRISLARALLIKPRVLLLDDPMSAVDAPTETAIQTTMADRVGGCTTLIIAHRLSTLRRADRIIVMERGMVTAIGRHETLMQQPGYYREAALAQIQRGDDSTVYEEGEAGS